MFLEKSYLCSPCSPRMTCGDKWNIVDLADLVDPGLSWLKSELSVLGNKFLNIIKALSTYLIVCSLSFISLIFESFHLIWSLYLNTRRLFSRVYSVTSTYVSYLETLKNYYSYFISALIAFFLIYLVDIRFLSVGSSSSPSEN